VRCQVRKSVHQILSAASPLILFQWLGATVARRPKYELKLTWGNFRLNIVGRATIIWWVALVGLAIGVSHTGHKLLDLFLR
jgi:hypothetical protein